MHLPLSVLIKFERLIIHVYRGINAPFLLLDKIQQQYLIESFWLTIYSKTIVLKGMFANILWLTVTLEADS